MGERWWVPLRWRGSTQASDQIYIYIYIVYNHNISLYIIIMQYIRKINIFFNVLYTIILLYCLKIIYMSMAMFVDALLIYDPHMRNINSKWVIRNIGKNRNLLSYNACSTIINAFLLLIRLS